MKLKDNPDLLYWVIGFKMIFLVGIMCIYYFLPTGEQSKIQDNLEWETLYRIIIILTIALAILYMATPIAKILAKNRTIQKWYMRRQT